MHSTIYSFFLLFQLINYLKIALFDEYEIELNLQN